MIKTIDQIKMEGWSALVEKLGVVEATRYLLQYRQGSGNYTKDRHQHFSNITLDNIITDIRQKYSNDKRKRSLKKDVK